MNSVNTKPIETAAELYREMKLRGLHLRSGNGRDDALILELAGRLGFPVTALQAHLDQSDLSAESFLKAFLLVAEPFARMFQEIWSYLASNGATGSSETISVRFGFPDSSDKCELDLEQFRRHAEVTQMVFDANRLRVWPWEALYKLLELGSILCSDRKDHYVDYAQHGTYRPGNKFAIPQVETVCDEMDEVAKSIGSLFQNIIDDAAFQHDADKRLQSLPEMGDVEIRKSDEGCNSGLEMAAQLLTDLLPCWFYILLHIREINDNTRSKGFQFFKTKIAPVLKSERGKTEVSVSLALDILDLPFWRNRWHTYEVWATCLTLKTLGKYQPVLREINGYVPIDGYTEGVIADLQARDCPTACVAVQVETPFKRGKRKAIKPDLRICSADSLTIEDTVAVVEFKQRQRLDAQEMWSLADDYSNGSPKAGGTVILNYDESGTTINMPTDCWLLEGVQPCRPQALQEFKDRILDTLVSVSFEPSRKVVILLDVSGSMQDMYAPLDVQDSLRCILQMQWVTVLMFNNGLVLGGDLTESQCSEISTEGGTELGKAIDQVQSLLGMPSKLLIVTDGGHDNPKSKLSSVDYKECLPLHLPQVLEWLR